MLNKQLNSNISKIAQELRKITAPVIILVRKIWIILSYLIRDREYIT